MMRRDAGFTLLEMLVAMSILSLAALALVRLDAFTSRSTANLSAKSLAQIVADNHAVDLLSAASAPTVGTASSSISNGGVSWQVITSVARTADPELLRIDIRVSGADGVSAQLTTIRPAQ